MWTAAQLTFEWPEYSIEKLDRCAENVGGIQQWEEVMRFKAPKVDRRSFVKLAAGASAFVALPAVLRAGPENAVGTIRIGYVSPITGPAAAFSEPLDWILKGIEAHLADGLQVNGQTWAVEIIVRDMQSNADRAAEVAADLILREEVHLILADSTPECTNPVSEQAELNGVPCITTNCPWQPYVYGRNGDPKVGWDWTYHFFWGLEDATAGFVGLWNSIDSNRKVGGLFPNDADGNAWADSEEPGALPLTCARNGYELISSGMLATGSQDYSAQIALFKRENVEIVTGVLNPPDFGIFWQQAAQLNYRPRVCTVAKALLFPSVVESIGDTADGLSTEVWWSPKHPFGSNLTGQSSKEFADAYMAATGKPWTQPIGFKHALFEVALNVLERTEDVESPESILEAIVATDYESIVGRIKWDNPDIKNVSKTSVVAGQWIKTATGFDLEICDNTADPRIPVTQPLRELI